MQVLDVLVSRLTQQIPGKQKACGDLALFQVRDHLVAVEGRTGAYGQGKAEPAGVGVGRGFGQMKNSCRSRRSGLEARKVGAALFDEAGQFLQLRDSMAACMSGHLEVVAMLASRCTWS